MVLLHGVALLRGWLRCWMAVLVLRVDPHAVQGAVRNGPADDYGRVAHTRTHMCTHPGLSFQISDEGGGIPRSAIDMIFTYVPATSACLPGACHGTCNPHHGHPGTSTRLRKRRTLSRWDRPT